MKKKTKAKLGNGLLILMFIITWLFWGNTRLQVSRFTVADETLPKSFDGYKIVHLSDLHSKNWGSKLIDSIKSEQPDIIVITGDLIDSSTVDLQVVLDLIYETMTIAPVYFVSGNHEARNQHYKELEKAIIEQGVTVLNNESVLLQMEEDKISILGLEDPSFSVKSNWLNEEETLVDATLEKLVENTNDYKILLSHRPDLFTTYADKNINVVFSGHAHGGQVRVPFIGGLIAPNQGLFPKYTSGVHQKDDTSMIISRGLGNSIIPLRVNNPAELVVVELTTK